MAEQPIVPEAFIEALRPLGLKRFIRVANHDKRAIDPKWPDSPLALDDPQLGEWLAQGGNYGVIAGEGLIVVDLDGPALAEGLPETLTIQSGRGGLHLYYRSDVGDNGMLEDAQGKNVGNIQVTRKYVVGAGSIHKNGNQYKVKNQHSIEWISKTQLEEAFKDMLSWAGIERFEATAKEEMRNLDASITDVIPTKELRRHGDELQGPHPLHGSETGQNFCVNTAKNVWHCFRHNSGGGPLSYIAVAEGILKCEDCQPGALKGAKFLEVVRIADEKYHLNVNKLSIERGLGKYFEVDARGNTHFLPIVFAKDLLKNYTFKTTRDNGTVYVFNGATGIYEAVGETVIQEEMAKILDEDTRQRYYADIVFYVKGLTYFDRPREQPNKLVLNNGILNMETYELEPFSDEKFLQIRVPVTYDPKLGCPLIQQFILEVVGEAQAPLLQEWIGYCLHARYPIHKAMILLGPGANGKSTLINLIARFLGEQNKASVTLQALCSNRFAASALDGKLVNLCADIPSKALGQTGMFKMLVGADSIPAERKFKDAYTFNNIAKLMFSTNEIPKTKDDTIAYFRRWVIINCTAFFPPGKANTKILDYICTPNEFSGLLNWALQGLKRLLEHGQFSDNRTWEQERERYLASSNSALAFIESHVEPSLNEKDRVTKEDLYTAYVTYCKANDLPIMRQADVTTTMRQAIPDAKEAQFRIGKERKKGWTYVTVTAVTASLLNTATRNTFAVLSRNEVTEVTPRRNDDKLEEALGHRPVDSVPSEPEKECVLCLKPLPRDLFDCTFYYGKLAHCVCVARQKAQGEQP
jgi:putative DNA primase/helicase